MNVNTALRLWSAWALEPGLARALSIYPWNTYKFKSWPHMDDLSHLGQYARKLAATSSLTVCKSSIQWSLKVGLRVSSIDYHWI